MFKKIILALASIVAVSLFSGCITSFQYSADELKHVKSIPAATQQPCYVERFSDDRGFPKNKNTIFLTWIPLVPYGEKESFHPEDGNMYLFVNSYRVDVSNDLANATILSLDKTGVFSSVSSSPTLKNAPGYTLSGSVYNFSVRETMTTYCCSFFGAILYFVGLPAGSSTNRIGVELTLTDNETNEIVWRSRLYDEEKMLLGIYYNSTRELGAFPQIYTRLINRAAPQIATAVKNYEAKKLLKKSATKHATAAQ